MPSKHVLLSAHSLTSKRETEKADNTHADAPQAATLHPTAQHYPLRTFTVSSVRCDPVTVVTGTFVAALQIDTAAMETDTREEALVHVWRKNTEEETRSIRKRRKPLRFFSFVISCKEADRAYVTGV